MSEIHDLLSQSDYFKGLSPLSLRSLAAVCSSRIVAKRDYLFLEGQKGHSVFLLKSGRIQLSRSSPSGKEVVIRTLEPGSLFAEVILFERDDFPVSALALEKSAVYCLPKLDFLRLLDDRSFRADFISHLMTRMRYLTDRILYLTTCDVEDRFFQFLKDQYGPKDVYTLAISKKDLAAAIGATPETLSRLILRLTKEKKIQWRGRIVRLLGR